MIRFRGSEETRGLPDGRKVNADHPILRGVSDIWTPTNIYEVSELEGENDNLIWGQSTQKKQPIRR